MRATTVVTTGLGLMVLAGGAVAEDRVERSANGPARTGSPATAPETLPVIVTYEMERRRDAERIARRDPKEFWVRQIVARLEDKKPTGSIGLAQPATTRLSFTVGRDGTVVSRTLAKTSGVAAVDKEALAMLDRAQPFPPMPAGMTEPALSFSLPLRFR